MNWHPYDIFQRFRFEPPKFPKQTQSARVIANEWDTIFLCDPIDKISEAIDAVTFIRNDNQRFIFLSRNAMAERFIFNNKRPSLSPARLHFMDDFCLCVTQRNNARVANVLIIGRDKFHRFRRKTKTAATSPATTSQT
jgi:hypothetical protein